MSDRRIGHRQNPAVAGLCGGHGVFEPMAGGQAHPDSETRQAQAVSHDGTQRLAARPGFGQKGADTGEPYLGYTTLEDEVSRYDNLVHTKDLMIRLLLGAVVGLALLLGLALVGWARAPGTITLHYPPDLSTGAEQQLGEIPKANIYSFAFYIFQQLNRWPNDGQDDYYERIHTLKHYLTPACYEERLGDHRARDRNNELAGRSRAVWEIPGRGFSETRVRATSNDSWVVGLDLHVQETYRGERVKDRLIHFPIRVVSYEVDPELNPWGLALDCYATKPRLIDVAEDNEEDNNT